MIFQSSNKLILSPPTALASPRAWHSVSEIQSSIHTYDEVHCTGGGSLLLFLMCQKGCSPRLSPVGKVYFHGPLVLPTASSCSDWLARVGAKSSTDESEWRRAGYSLGMAGNLNEACHEWLKPLARSVASGRSHELVHAFHVLMERSEQKGRHLQLDAASSAEARFILSTHSDKILQTKPITRVHSHVHESDRITASRLLRLGLPMSKNGHLA